MCAAVREQLRTCRGNEWLAEKVPEGMWCRVLACSLDVAWRLQMTSVWTVGDGQKTVFDAHVTVIDRL
jgi:hypothetical protein